jgi:hypothetical protein
MTPEDSYQTPFDTDESNADSPEQQSDSNSESLSSEDLQDLDASQAAWEDAVDRVSAGRDEFDEAEDEKLTELANPFVGMWNQLISTTNWEKGRIVSGWRQALIESGAKSQQYSDEAWANRVGGVTAPHIGRLRRVHDRFVTTYESYQGLYWSHFLAALDWEDAPLWLEGASQENWSVSQMRDKRWQSLGAVETDRPLTGDIVVVDTDEDVVMPAQGGGGTKDYGDEPGAASGPVSERPDFGDEGEELTSLSGSTSATAAPVYDDTVASSEPALQPFSGLPELPDDLSDAIESLKLSILRHKTSGWSEIDQASVQKYLDAIRIMMG